MTIISTDSKKYVDIGSGAVWQALCSTAAIRLDTRKKEFGLAMDFLQSGACISGQALETARSVNCLHDALSALSPDKAVFDASDLSKPMPWGSDISPTITSCGNYFTTTDGKDLLAELVELLTYAYYGKVDVRMM